MGGIAIPSVAFAQRVIADATVQTASGTIDTGTLNGSAGYGLYALNGGVINSFSPLIVTTGGGSASSVVAFSGGQISIFDGSSITAGGSSAYGLYARGTNSTITATNTNILSTGMYGDGAHVDTNGTINVTGGSLTGVARGVYAFNGGTFSATNVAITTTGAVNSYGVESNSSGHIVLNGGSVTTTGTGSNNFGLYVIDSSSAASGTVSLTATATTVQTVATNADGANVNVGRMVLNNVTITTDGINADGAVVDGINDATAGASTLTMNGGSITTQSLTGSAHGLVSLTGAVLTASDVTVTTLGGSSLGATVQFGAQLNLSSSTINTAGSSAHGLFAVASGGPANAPAQITATNSTITTTGANAHGALVRSTANLNLDGTFISTNGTGAAALYSSTYQIAGLSTATLTNSSLSSAQAAGIRVVGQVTATSQLNVSLLLGSSITGHTNAIEVANNGMTATLNLTADASTLAGGAMVDAGSTSNVTLQNGSLWNMTAPVIVSSLSLDSSTLRYGAAGVSVATTTPIAFLAGGGMIDTNGFDEQFDATISGAGGLTKAGAGVLTLTAANTYTGGTMVSAGTLQVAPASTTSMDNLGAGTVNIAAGGTLAATTNGAFSFDNALTGTGTLSASNSGQAFSFGTGAGSAFAGTVALSNDTFTLSDANTAALTQATLVLGAGNVTTVGDGTQAIGGLTFNGGTTVFNGAAPAQLVANSLITAGTLDVSGTGTVRINVPNPYVLPTPTPVGDLSLFQQSHVNSGLQLVAASSVTGSAGGLTLQDQNSNAISAAQSVNVQQNGNLVAIGTYNYVLGTGASNDGLYVGYGLSELALQTGQNLTLTENVGAIGNDADLAARLTGAGNLVIAANNVVSLSNPANTFTGTTLVQSGTLQANTADVIASSSAVDVESIFNTNGYNQSVNNLTGGSAAQILLSGGNALTLNGGVGPNTFAGVISGDGSLMQASGTMVLTGTNSYADGTTISGGTLIGSATSFGTGAILNNAALVIDQATDASFANAIGGTGTFTKQGAGTLLDLTGTSTLSGATTVESGTLAVNGSLANSIVTVRSGATLGGIGTVGGIVAGSGATVTPGNNGGIGTLSVAGNVTFNAGSTYQVALNPSTASLIKATGTATINGGAVQVLAGSGNYAPATTYTILTATGGRTGAFDGVTTNLAFFTPSLTDDATNVYLTMTRNDSGFADIGDTPNQRAAGEGTESLGSGNPIFDAAVQLDVPTVRNAFDQLSGEVHVSARTALIEDSRFVRDAALDRLRLGSCGISGGTTSFAANNPDRGGVDAGCDRDQAVTWARAFGSWGQTASDGNAAGLSRSIGGLFMGADGQVFENWRVGILGGFSRSDFNVKDRGSSGTSDNYTLGAYVGNQWGNLAFRAGAAYTWHDLSTSRSVFFPGFSDSLRGNYNAGTAQAFGELGYSVKAGDITLEPFANLAYVNLHTDGFTERGGAAALTNRSASTDTTFTTLGLRGSTSFTLDGMKVTATGSLGWRHAFGDMTPTSTMAFAGGSSPFSIAGVPIAKDAAVIDAGLDLAISPNATLGLSYSGQFGSGVTDNSVRANFRLKF